MNYSLDDVFNKGVYAEDLTKSLGSSLHLNIYNNCYMEITLNYPPNAAYRRMSDDNIKLMYDRLFDYCLVAEKLKEHIIDIKKNFEYGKNGKLHLHAILSFQFIDDKYCPQGLIQSFVKCWLRQLPKRFSVWSDSSYWFKFYRYRCPSICCQVNTELKRALQFADYIKKDCLI